MRILYISSYSPLPTTNGARMRLWTVLQAIANTGHQITLIAFGDPAEFRATEAQLRTVCADVELVPFQLIRMADNADYFSRLLAMFSSQPFLLRRFRSPEMRACLERRLSGGEFDVVICDNVPAAVNLPDTPVPLVMNSCDVGHVLLQRYAEKERNPAKKLYAQLEATKVRKAEATAFGRGKFAMACSNDDAKVFRRLCPNLQVFIVPNVVDVHEYEVAQAEDPDTIVFVGSMDSVPNRDALQYMVREILPLVQAQVPGVRLIAAGRNAAPEFRARFSQVRALEFTGTVPDIRPIIARAAVSVIPLRIGSGTRIKILESAAMGKAMVSTTLGAEGLDFVNGKEILIADDPQEFADNVTMLLRDADRRKKLGEAARKRVLVDYDLAALQRSIEGALTSIDHQTHRGGGASDERMALQKI